LRKAAAAQRKHEAPSYEKPRQPKSEHPVEHKIATKVEPRDYHPKFMPSSPAKSEHIAKPKSPSATDFIDLKPHKTKKTKK